MGKRTDQVINREISWLAFNERVLMEAADPTVPLIERLRFLGIFSNNQDEFFRVRFATIKRIVNFNIKNSGILGGSPTEILQQIRDITRKHRFLFEETYSKIKSELEKEGVNFVNEKDLTPEQGTFVKQYFDDKVRPVITPIMVDQLNDWPVLNERHIYLAVKMSNSANKDKARYSFIEVPTNVRSRFLVLPEEKGKKYIILLDDVIRYNLRQIFYLFETDELSAYTIKVTKDAELDIDNDVSSSFIDQLAKSLKKRHVATTVRFIYDEEMPPEFLEFLRGKFNVSTEDSVVAGGRYHNFKDFIDFPDLGLRHLRYKHIHPLSHKYLKPYTSIIQTIAKKDTLLHLPYQAFHHVTDFLQEAAIDPKVTHIYITLYRVSRVSAVVNALINALRNGKKVTVVMELQARFDEENNIYWANRLQEEGAHLIPGVKSLKVHCKLLLIKRKDKGSETLYANIGTGNFNEMTARLYTDKSFFTADPQITREVAKLFEFFDNNLKIFRYKHLLVSPFFLRKRLYELIANEIKFAKKGKPAFIWIKVNGLIDIGMIQKLYDASNAGVKIRLIVRGVCALIPGVKGMSENIEAISVVDRFLEHSRIYMFGNGGAQSHYISSADWMTRNLDHRIEVACPIYDLSLRKELSEVFEIQWKDNTKARLHNGAKSHEYRKKKRGQKNGREQEDIYNYLKARHTDG
ncbi:polyphosphate kinase 1 [soil metagenome]